MRRFSPNIDHLGARPVEFTEAHDAQVANCAPSRASILTGMRPDWTGVLDLGSHIRDLRPDVVTLPQRFRMAGYLAVSYGKIYHQYLDDQPSWSSQYEFPDNHTYRGLRGLNWRWAGGFRYGWKYCQYHLQYNRHAIREQARAPPHARTVAAAADSSGVYIHLAHTFRPLSTAVPPRGRWREIRQTSALFTRASHHASAAPTPTRRGRATPTTARRRTPCARLRCSARSRGRGSSPSVSSGPTCHSTRPRRIGTTRTRDPRRG